MYLRLRAGAPDVSSNVSQFEAVSAAVLGIVARTPASVRATAETAALLQYEVLVSAGLTHAVADRAGRGPCLFNETGANYYEAAAPDAWARVLAWFGEHPS